MEVKVNVTVEIQKVLIKIKVRTMMNIKVMINIKDIVMIKVYT